MTGLLAGLMMMNAAAAQSTPAASAVIDCQHPGVTVSENYIGLSYETWMMKPDGQGKYYFSRENRPLVNLFRTLGVKSLRLGGNSVDVKGGYTPSDNDIDALFSFAREAGVKVIYSVRLQDKVVDGQPTPAANVKDAARQAKYIWDNYADLLDCFAVGNEPGYYKDYEKDLSPRWEAIMKEMRKVAPRARFCGPDDNPHPLEFKRYWQDFGIGRGNEFSRDSRRVLSFLSLHSYPGGCSYRNPGSARNWDELIPYDYKERSRFMLSKAMSDETGKVYDKMAFLFDSIPFRLTETNSYWYSGLDGASNAHSAALWALDHMCRWAEKGCLGINFHTGDRVGGDQMLPRYSAFISQGEGFEIYPLSYALKTFDLFAMDGQMIPVALEGKSQDISAYAVKARDGGYRLLLINKDTASLEFQPVNVCLSDRSLTLASASYTQLSHRLVPETGRSGRHFAAAKTPDEIYLSKKGQIIGGQEIQSDGRLAEPRWQTAEISNGTVAVSLPPLSATVLRMVTMDMPAEIEPVNAPFDMPDMKRPVFPDRSLSIAKAGARQRKLSTAAIQKAIDRISAQGGGTVIVPKGEWLSGRIILKDNVNLHLEEGAELHFSGEIKDYLPVVQTRNEGVDIWSMGAMIYADGAENIAVTGRGKLVAPARDCQMMKQAMGGVPESLQEMSMEERVFDGRDGGKVCLPQFIGPINCRNIFIEGITLEKSIFWNIVPVYCENIIIRGVTVSSHGMGRTDGIDIDSSVNALIEYTTLDCGDDCFTLKAGRGMDGVRRAKPTENVVIRYCRVKRGVGGVTMGSETAAMIRNVYMHDCVMESPQFGFYFKTRRPRGGGGENMWFERIHIIRSTKEAFCWDMLGSATYVGAAAQRHPAPAVNELTPAFRNIFVKDVQVDACRDLVKATGLPESPVENVIFENIRSSNRNIRLQDVGKFEFR